MFKKIYLGLTDLEGYGTHPGTIVVVGLVSIGALAGSQQGIKGLIGGALFMALFVVPMYLYGAYGRGDSYLKDQEKKALKELSNETK